MNRLCDLAVMVEFLHLNGRQYMSECAACLVCVDHSYSAEQEHTHNHCPIIYLNNIASFTIVTAICLHTNGIIFTTILHLFYPRLVIMNNKLSHNPY